MIIIGIDPGNTGGIAIFHPLEKACYDPRAYKMPDTEADIVELLKSVAQHLSGIATYLEKVHSMPKQGVSSVFTFGQNYGMLRGILAALGLRREFVTPQQWQKEMKCITPSHWTKTQKKNFHKSRAQELFPGMKITHAIADALLIAEYGRRTEASRSGS